MITRATGSDSSSERAELSFRCARSDNAAKQSCADDDEREPLFRTGWFVESLLTELVVALVVRTRRPFFRSKPGKVLLVSTMVLIPVTFAIPYVPHIGVLGFVTVPPSLLAVLAGVTALYVLATELMKKWFYRRAV